METNEIRGGPWKSVIGVSRRRNDDQGPEARAGEENCFQGEEFPSLMTRSHRQTDGALN